MTCCRRKSEADEAGKDQRWELLARLCVTNYGT